MLMSHYKVVISVIKHLLTHNCTCLRQENDNTQSFASMIIEIVYATRLNLYKPPRPVAALVRRILYKTELVICVTAR
jgi:hypothetical protein